jgi:hypothetical protein
MLEFADVSDRDHVLLAQYVADRDTALRDVPHGIRLFRRIARELLQMVDLGGDAHGSCDDVSSVTCKSFVESRMGI